MHSRRKAVGTWRWSLSVLAGCLALTFALPARAAGVTDEMIQNDAKTPGDVLSYGGTPHQHRFSALAKINAQNVHKLVPAWTFSFGGEKQRGQQAQPVVYNGKIFTTAGIKTKSVATSVSGHSVIVKKISVSPMSDEELASSIQGEAALGWAGFDRLPVLFHSQVEAQAPEDRAHDGGRFADARVRLEQDGPGRRHGDDLLGRPADVTHRSDTDPEASP